MFQQSGGGASKGKKGKQCDGKKTPFDDIESVSSFMLSKQKSLRLFRNMD